MRPITLQLAGLDCAACATNIQKEVSKVPGVTHCVVSFATQKLSYQVDDSIDPALVEAEAIERIANIEPDVSVGSKPEASVKKGLSEIQLAVLRIVASASLTAISLFIPMTNWLQIIIYLGAYLIIGYDILLKAVRNTMAGNVFDENFLMSIATLGALAIQQFPEAVAVMLFYQVGEVFQDLALDKSRKSITSLLAIRPDVATLETPNGPIELDPNEVKVNDLISVKAGEKIPLDGTVTAGDSFVDTAALTGESTPRRLSVGDTALSGTINQTSKLTIQVTKPFGSSTVAKILDLVENASNQKAPTEQFITKFARIYTPIVVGLAVLLMVLPPLLIPGATFNEWIYRGLVFLVISCPCALVISIPLSFFGGIGAASKQGILIKGSNYLEALNDVDTFVFDKTGTLTTGTFDVTQVNPSDLTARDTLLQVAASLEQETNHPIGKSILAAAKALSLPKVTNLTELAGSGVTGEIDGQTVFAGKADWLIKQGFTLPATSEIGTIVHVSRADHYLGYLVIADTLKPDTKKALADLSSQGINKTVMLTGDNQMIATAVGQEIGIGKAYGNLLPQDKVSQMQKIINGRKAHQKVAFVGDGINDTPVLALADLGIAMGGLGSDAAIEAADMVIMSDEPSKLPVAVRIAKRTRMIVAENIGLALIVKLIFLTLGALGIATMWEAVFSDVGVTLIAVLNAVRILRIK